MREGKMGGIEGGGEVEGNGKCCMIMNNVLVTSSSCMNMYIMNV